MNYSFIFVLACLAAASSGFVVRSPTPVRGNFDNMKPQVSQSPLVNADPSQGKIFLPSPVVSPTTSARYTDPVYSGTTLHRQKRIMQLLVDLREPSTIPDIADTAKDFSVVYNLEKYVDENAVEDYWILQQEGLIFRNKKFSIFNERHQHEAISLFKVLYGAKDFDIFYRTAAWARQNINEGCFIYALTLAVLHREDTRDIILPNLYEIYPWYFVHGDILRKVDNIKTQTAPTINDEGEYLGARVVNGTAIFDVQITSSMMHNNNEEALAYFTEDIGLNMFYYYEQMMNPHWLNTNSENTKFGENWYYFHQQMLARYYLERLSTGLGEIPEFSWDASIKTGYNPALTYPNGEMFPERKDNYTIDANDNTEYLMFVKTYEQTLMQLLKSDDFLNMKGGMKLALENIVASMFKPEILSSNFQGKNYDAVARYLLGASRGMGEHKEFGFSTMEHYETSFRDPMFWQLQKHIMNFLLTYKNTLPKYTETELNFPGVRVTNVDITKLYTQFEYYEVDLNNIFPKTYIERTIIEGEEISKPLNIKAAQVRLNHKPFIVKISVSSERAVESIVRIFIAPKLDGNGRLIDLDANKYNFVELDSFFYTLNVGDNIIVRKSEEFKNIAGDLMSTSEMFEKVENALLGLDLFRMNKNETFTGFPSRLLLPKGTKTGLLMQMFVIVSPLIRQSSVYNYANPTESDYYENEISLGYPFDRRIDTSDFYQLNMFIKDVVVTNKGKENKKSGAGRPPMTTLGKGNEMLRQVDKTPYDYTSEKSFDYMAKKIARENMDYSTKFSNAGKIEAESQAENIISENTMDSELFSVTPNDMSNMTTSNIRVSNNLYGDENLHDSLNFEKETIKIMNDSSINIEFDKTVKDRQNNLDMNNDEDTQGHGLLRSSGANYNYSRKRFDYATKRDANKELQNEYSKKMNDNHPKDNSLDTNKIHGHSIITDNMIIDKPVAELTNKDMNGISGNNRLLRSSGKFDYSRKRFDYAARKDARKEVEMKSNNKMDDTQSNTDKMVIDIAVVNPTIDDSGNSNGMSGNIGDIDANENFIPIMDLHLYEIVSDQKDLDRLLLRSSKKYDFLEDKLDHSSEKKEKVVQRGRKEDEKIMIKTKRDKAIFVNDDADGVLDIKYINNIDVNTGNVVKDDFEQTNELNTDLYSSINMLLRSSGKFDYSRNKFDYSSKKKERKEVERARKEGIKILIKTKRDKAIISNEDVDGVLDVKYIDNIDDSTENNIEYDSHQITRVNTDSDSSLMDLLLRSSGKYDYSEDKFDYSSKKKERKEVERARKEAIKLLIKTRKDEAIIVSKDFGGELDIKYIDNISPTKENMVEDNFHQKTEQNTDLDSRMDTPHEHVQDGALDLVYERKLNDNTIKENYNMDNQQILNNILLKSTGKTQINYDDFEDYKKQLRKELKKSMKREKKMAAAEEKKIRDRDFVTEDVLLTTTQIAERQENSVDFRDDTYIHQTNTEDVKFLDTDFGDSEEDKNKYGSSDLTYQNNNDAALGVDNSKKKFPENIHDYVFYDNFYPLYE